MQASNKHPQETERLVALQALEILDTAPEKMFDQVVELASQVLGTPIALLSLVDDERQWFKSRVGIDANETARSQSFCSHAILDSSQPLVVEDATCDPRFLDNPLVTGAPNIRFYAGMPVNSPYDRLPLGTLCVIDRKPRQFSTKELGFLKTLAKQIEHLLELRTGATALKELVTELGRSEAKIRGIIDNGQTFVGLMTVDGTLIDANRPSLAAAGVAAEAVLGKLFWETPWWTHSAELQKRLKDAVLLAASGKADRFEATHPTPDGSLIEVDFTISPIFVDGEIAFLVPEGRDITLSKQRARESEKYLKELQKTNAELEQFASIASHDLQEPLRKITAYAELVREDSAGQLSQDANQYLGIVIDGAERLKRLVGDLLTFSRITTRGKDQVPTDANASLHSALDNLELIIQENNALITFDELPAVNADDSQLIMLFQNLVINAIKYRSKRQPQIHIGAREIAGGHEFYVKDNGIGIESKYFERVFEIFKRLHARQEHGGGTGIGLANCKRIVERFGGQIGVESTPGEGSVFTFSINDGKG